MTRITRSAIDRTPASAGRLQRRRAGHCRIGGTATLLLLSGCASPLAEPDSAQTLRRSIVESARRELTEATARPAPVRTTQTRVDGVSSEDQRARLETRREELDKIAGPNSIDASPDGLPPMRNLYGEPVEVAAISLQEAIRLAVANNLETRFARLTPGISAAQIIEAEAAFDWTFFASAQWENLDQPVVGRSATGFDIGGQFRKSENVNTQIGVRRLLSSGARVTLDQQLNYLQQGEAGLALSPNPAWDLTWNLQVEQPLLRGFGRDVNLAQVRIARNAERDAVARFRADLIRIVLQTERAYWDLLTAHRDVLILSKLLEQGQEVNQRVRGRAQIDATPAQIETANATIAEREANLKQGIGALRQRSDSLKRLINDPSLPLASETLLLPSEMPMREAVRYSLADSITTAVRVRPEVDQAILSIQDTTTRLLVAQNSRLPTLDLRIRLAVNALNDGMDSVYSDGFERDFVDIVAGLFFEQPIGSRAANADTRRRTLERQQAVLSLQNTIQGIILEVKNALNNIVVNYDLVDLREIARLAAAESLRALRIENRTTGGYTIERLELEFNRQQSVAAAEQSEIRAQVSYQIAIAEFYAATGAILERNGIRIVIPEGDADSRLPE